MNSSSISSSEVRFRLRVVGFLVGAILTVVMLYQVGGHGRKDEKTWFRSVGPTAGGDTLEILFVGSSRVAASVDPATFDSVGTLIAGRPVRAINLGMGYSTLHEIYFGLRSLAHEGKLKDRLVYLEAPGGLPRHMRWDDPWFEGDTRTMLSRYMERQDILDMWSRSALPLSDKVLVSIEVLTGWTNNFWRLRIVASDKVRGSLEEIGSNFRPQDEKVAVHSLSNEPAHELVFSRGGIRLDVSQIEKVRRAAIVGAAKETADLRPWTGWDSTVLADIIKLVRANGSELGFFKIPLCTYQQKVYESPRRRAGAIEFEEFLKANQLALVSVDTAYKDENFPDLWHLGIPSARDFSVRLSKALAQQKRENF
jgi:hypothetical protein